ARPGRLPRARGVPGPALPLAGRPGAAPEAPRDRAPEGPPGEDRGRRPGPGPTRRRPRRGGRAGLARALDDRGPAPRRRGPRPEPARGLTGRPNRSTPSDRSLASSRGRVDDGPVSSVAPRSPAQEIPMVRTGWLAALILALAPSPSPAQFGGMGGM